MGAWGDTECSQSVASWSHQNNRASVLWTKTLWSDPPPCGRLHLSHLCSFTYTPLKTHTHTHWWSCVSSGYSGLLWTQINDPNAHPQWEDTNRQSPLPLCPRSFAYAEGRETAGYMKIAREDITSSLVLHWKVYELHDPTAWLKIASRALNILCYLICEFSVMPREIRLSPLILSLTFILCQSVCQSDFPWTCTNVSTWI